MQDIIKGINDHITDIHGAIAILAGRSGREYSKATLHTRVRDANLPAYVFDTGVLVRWDRENAAHRGKEYIFLRQDIQDMPIGNKAGRKPKTKLETH